MKREEKEDGLRSAYEIALAKTGGVQESRLTAEQRERLAAIEREFQAREAELRIGYEGRLKSARQAGDWDKVRELEEELQRELRRLEEKKERRKERVRAER